MKTLDLYKFCPNCKTGLNKSEIKVICPKCEYYRYFNPIPCNTAVIRNLKNEILLVRRKYDPYKGMWDSPGGFIDLGENAEESMTREVEEEVGVKILKWKYIASFEDKYEFEGIELDLIGFAFEGFLEDTQNIRPGDDATEARFFNADELPINEIGFPSVRKLFKKIIKTNGD